jgi:hypothetical protein
MNLIFRRLDCKCRQALLPGYLIPLKFELMSDKVLGTD